MRLSGGWARRYLQVRNRSRLFLQWGPPALLGWCVPPGSNRSIEDHSVPRSARGDRRAARPRRALPRASSRPEYRRGLSSACQAKPAVAVMTGSSFGAVSLPCPLFGAFARFLQTIGLAFDGDDLGVVDQAIDERDHASSVGKDLAPLGERSVGGHQGAGLLGG